jgi:hypothetical protein
MLAFVHFLEQRGRDLFEVGFLAVLSEYSFHVDCGNP